MKLRNRHTSARFLDGLETRTCETLTNFEISSTEEGGKKSFAAKYPPKSSVVINDERKRKRKKEKKKERKKRGKGRIRSRGSLEGEENWSADWQATEMEKRT